MIVPRVRVQSRVPGFEKKSLMIIGFKTNDLDIFKVHTMAEKVIMACNFRILVKKAVARFDQNSKVAGHVHIFGHLTNFENVEWPVAQLVEHRAVSREVVSSTQGLKITE